MAPLKIRPLTEQDLPDVERIQAHVTRQPVPQSWMEMVAEHVEQHHRIGLVAEQDGDMVGFILGEIKIGGFGTELSGWLELVGVEPDNMGSGVGAALATEFFSELTRRGVNDVLTAVRWDRGDMLAFFKKMGFDQSPYINLHRSGD